MGLTEKRALYIVKFLAFVVLALHICLPFVGQGNVNEKEKNELPGGGSNLIATPRFDRGTSGL
jgi:hypothetical protein